MFKSIIQKISNSYNSTPKWVIKAIEHILSMIIVNLLAYSQQIGNDKLTLTTVFAGVVTYIYSIIKLNIISNVTPTN